MDFAKAEKKLEFVMETLRSTIKDVPGGHPEYDGGLGTLRNNLEHALSTIGEELDRLREMAGEPKSVR